MMKKVLLLFVLAFAVLLGFSGCSAMDPDDDTYFSGSFKLEGPDGRMPLLVAGYWVEFADPGNPDFEDPGNIIHVSVVTADRTIQLSVAAFNDTKVGKELNLKGVYFGVPQMSDSDNYTYSFTGRMILKEKTGNKVVIRFKNVRFSIPSGNYHLNGTMVAERLSF